MLAVLTSRQIAEWIAYYRIEPFGTRVFWAMASMLACLMANIWSKKGGRRFTVKDFMPAEPKPKPRKQSMEKMREILIGIFRVAKKKGLTKEPRDAR